MPFIFIIIAVHNRKEKTDACLRSLTNQTIRRFKTVVVDDGCTDGTSEMISALYPEVSLIRGSGNLWWTGATNTGIRYVLDICNINDYILLVNDDLIVPADYIEKAYSLIALYPDTLIGSAVIDIANSDIIHSGGIRINWWNAKTKMFLNKNESLSSFPKGYTLPVSSLTGRGVLIPLSVFREIGLYNEQHYKQCGDLELPVRASKAGYPLIVSYDLCVFCHIKDNPKSINHLPKLGFKNIHSYFWDIRSYTNLKYRFYFAYDGTESIFQGTIYFLFDLMRITVHMLRKFKVF
jgi:N-acetylglucosaminyl-diphospho-decaprenol L-rhamnosyltransferase